MKNDPCYWLNPFTDRFEVANMSLGSGYYRPMNQAVAKAVAKGVVFVVAAGNESSDASTKSPASEPSAITVSALADSDGLPGGNGPNFYTSEGLYTEDDTLAPFSNYGSVVDICAPGVLINSTVPGGGYDATYSGTSMASPHVAGAAALYIAYHGLTKSAAGVEVVANAIKSSGWQKGEPGYILSGDRDNFPEPLLNVARLMGTVPNQPPAASFTYNVNGLSVTFRDTSKDSDGSIASWSWNFGDGGTSDNQNPSHTYTSAGTYNVTLTVTDNDGGSSTVEQLITVTDSAAGIDLTYRTRVERSKRLVDLSWTGATAPVTIYRDGKAIKTGYTGTFYTDNVSKLGTGPFEYWVVDINDTKSDVEMVSF